MTNNYEIIKKRLMRYSDKKLAYLLEQEANKPGWTTTRSLYLAALKDLIARRRR